MNYEIENKEIKEKTENEIILRLGSEECPKCFSESGYFDASLDCYVCGNCGNEF